MKKGLHEVKGFQSSTVDWAGLGIRPRMSSGSLGQRILVQSDEPEASTSSAANPQTLRSKPQEQNYGTTPLLAIIPGFNDWNNRVQVRYGSLCCFVPQ